jgi:GDPmannose 4,6-dehydratase
MRKALITGITGQDGQHLTQFLLAKDYEVFGFLYDIEKVRNSQFAQRFPDVKLIQGNLADFLSVKEAIDFAQPDEIYNLGAITFVGDSFKIPEFTANVTGP